LILASGEDMETEVYQQAVGVEGRMIAKKSVQRLSIVSEL